MIDRLDAAAAAHDAADVLSMFDWLGPAIDADARDDRFARWGRSTVVDENVGAPVLSRSMFEALHDRAGLDAAWPVGNAGLLHVYGYLLSTTPTPYGLKRDRWLGGDLAGACGLAPGAFVPWGDERTLLDRVTETAAGLIADTPVRRQQLGDREAIIAIADRQPHPSALAYALDSSAQGRRLITMFPVVDPTALLAELDAEPPRLRWNAVA
ncbi:MULTISPECIES: amino acid deaminase [unclassified Microbacterium]|uniref:amino acid deaminase n=1 Tax=unclassified Microbacterium TaxID=2609290 RepID=UPI001F118999|nr:MULTISPECIES: amino acid deaminase [unclassified Microbacterium]